MAPIFQSQSGGFASPIRLIRPIGLIGPMGARPPAISPIWLISPISLISPIKPERLLIGGDGEAFQAKEIALGDYLRFVEVLVVVLRLREAVVFLRVVVVVGL